MIQRSKWNIPRNRTLIGNAVFSAFVAIVLIVHSILDNSALASLQGTVLGEGYEWSMAFAAVAVVSIMALKAAARCRTALALASGVYIARAVGVAVGLFTEWPSNWPTYFIAIALWVFLGLRNAYSSDETLHATSDELTLRQAEEWSGIRHRR